MIERSFEFVRKDLSEYIDYIDELVVETDYKGIDLVSGLSKNLIEIEIEGTKGKKEVPFNLIHIKLDDKIIYTNIINLEMEKAFSYNMTLAQIF